MKVQQGRGSYCLKSTLQSSLRTSFFLTCFFAPYQFLSFCILIMFLVTRFMQHLMLYFKFIAGVKRAYCFFFFFFFEVELDILLNSITFKCQKEAVRKKEVSAFSLKKNVNNNFFFYSRTSFSSCSF